jgi:hypothetical protein
MPLILSLHIGKKCVRLRHVLSTWQSPCPSWSAVRCVCRFGPAKPKLSERSSNPSAGFTWILPEQTAALCLFATLDVTSAESALTRSVQLTPVESAFTEMAVRKSFGIRTYKKGWAGGCPIIAAGPAAAFAETDYPVASRVRRSLGGSRSAGKHSQVIQMARRSRMRLIVSTRASAGVASSHSSASRGGRS